VTPRGALIPLRRPWWWVPTGNQPGRPQQQAMRWPAAVLVLLLVLLPVALLVAVALLLPVAVLLLLPPLPRRK
jgi:hypothetical protein